MVTISNSVDLVGGWNSDFTSKSGISILDGQNQAKGIRIPLATRFPQAANLDHGQEQRGGNRVSLHLHLLQTVPSSSLQADRQALDPGLERLLRI
jgi:hypothetical protein